MQHSAHCLLLNGRGFETLGCGHLPGDAGVGGPGDMWLWQRMALGLVDELVPSTLGSLEL